jgi:hypothetical protein
MICFFLSIFNLKITFGFSIKPLIDIFDFSIASSIFAFMVLIERRILILFSLASRTGIFNSLDNFRLSIDDFLVSELPPCSF